MFPFQKLRNPFELQVQHGQLEQGFNIFETLFPKMFWVVSHSNKDKRLKCA